MKFLKKTVLTLAIFLAAISAQAQVVIGGNPNADLTVEVYSDFQCPYCARGVGLVDRILQDYPKQVRVVFRNRPLSSIHDQADLAAKAFIAVTLQNPKLAKKFSDEIFAHQADLSARGEVYLAEAATRVGADAVLMKRDMQTPRVEAALQADIAAAEALEIVGTPTFMVGTEKVTGAVPYADLKAKIEKHLAH